MKNKVLLTSVLFVMASSSVFSSQTFCKTLDDKNVVLKANGTWNYTDSNVYKKSVDAKSVAKSKKNSLCVWFDDKTWTKSKNQINDNSEFSFSMNDGTGYAIMINEQVGVSHRLMRNTIIDYTRNLEDSRIVCEESRIVNNLPVTYYEIHGTYEGTNAQYLLYVFNGEDETTQLVAFTLGNKLPKVKNHLEEFINGLSKS